MWDGANDRYELVTSPAVIDELQRGPETKRDDWLGMIAARRASGVRHRRRLPEAPHHAGRSGRRCTSTGHCLISRVRLSGNMELPASGQREQVRTYPQDRRHAGFVHPRAGHSAGTPGRKQCRLTPTPTHPSTRSAKSGGRFPQRSITTRSDLSNTTSKCKKNDGLPHD